jgi:hypothetical protein
MFKCLETKRAHMDFVPFPSLDKIIELLLDSSVYLTTFAAENEHHHVLSWKS